MLNQFLKRWKLLSKLSLHPQEVECLAHTKNMHDTWQRR